MLNNKRVRGVWWVCAAVVAVLAAGCVTAGSEEPGGASGSVVDSASSTAASSPSSSSVGTVATSTTALSSSTSTTTTVLFGGGGAGTSGFVFEEVFSEEEFAKAELEMALFFGRVPDFNGYPDEYIAALAFFMRALVGDDPFAIDSNDRSTPLGAFCWVVLSVSFASASWVENTERVETPWRYNQFLRWWRIVQAGGIAEFSPIPRRDIQFLSLWRIEREAAERGLELDWDTGPVVGYVPSVEFVLEEALAPDVRQMVFSPGLPQVLRPWAAALYVLLEEWSALPVVDVARPTVDDFLSGDEGSPYHGFEEITEEEIARIWPWNSEVMLSTEEIDEFEALLRDMDIEEVRSIVDSECKFRSLSGGWIENACPPWVAEVVSFCDLPEDEPRWGSLADL